MPSGPHRSCSPRLMHVVVTVVSPVPLSVEVNARPLRTGWSVSAGVAGTTPIDIYVPESRFFDWLSSVVADASAPERCAD